ncbi:MAG TPA: DUF92 domain-containing protein [Gemmatimonadales bacterium]|nr:DUF92 domain-containing protein [Gemmatimonadales bacterium]
MTLDPRLAFPRGAGIAALAWRARALSPSGAVAAAAVGAATLWGTGWWGGAILLTFFVGSTLVSRACPDPAAERGEAKGGRRDAGQVLANGGAPALGALLGLVDPAIGVWALTVGLAAAAADTWATSLGGTSPAPPRHLLTWRPVPPGTSGGISWRGSLGGILGAASVALAGLGATGDLRLLGAATLYGTAGMLLDSLLGATLQGRFRCDACDLPTERRVHACGATTRRVGGLRWLGNDGVNAVATLLATLAGSTNAALIGAMTYYQR